MSNIGKYTANSTQEAICLFVITFMAANLQKKSSFFVLYISFFL